MRIIHTSDWHLGRSLYGRKRYEEFEAFLDWLAALLAEEKIDVLLVAGDIFDNTAPSIRSQELYYQFLCRVAESSCRHVIITAGNHDSPSFLNAPRTLLRHLHIYVVGNIGDRVDDEVLVLEDQQGHPGLIVCAVPYLRDRDIRSVEAGETVEDKDRKLLEGVRDHYARICSRAEEIQAQLETVVPIVAMGHLFAAGGSTVEGDGVRELYVGSLAHVAADIFPPSIDYLALGHLHSAQIVGGQEKYRYSGAPLPMGFGETFRTKTVVKLEFSEDKIRIDLIPVPLFQKLQRIQGNWQQIEEQLQVLKSEQTGAWLEIIYEGTEIISDLREKLDEAVKGCDVEILRVNNKRVWDREMSLIGQGEMLSELDVKEVFGRCLDAHEVPEDQREELRLVYDEVIAALDLADWLAE
jgi:exonuclease SbcD